MPVPMLTYTQCSNVFLPPDPATFGDGRRRRQGKGGVSTNPNVMDLLRRLNLMEEEEAVVVDFSDDEDEEEPPPVEWAIVEKVLSPAPVHVNTVRSAMKPAWGNPVGLKLRAIGDKSDNMFVAEFGCRAGMDQALAGTPWMVGRYAVILQDYDEKLSALEIVFYRMEVWVRILNLPLGWMNRTRGARAMNLIGNVVKMDVDADGKASGAYQRAVWPSKLINPCREGCSYA